MPPWLAAGMIIASVIAFLFVYNSTENEEQQQQQQGHTGRGTFRNQPREPNQSGERIERYDTLPNFRHRGCDDEQDSCPICLEPIYNRPQRTLACSHRLHSSCYSQFRAQQSDSCPICRRKL